MPEEWKVSKQISLGNIITIIGVAISIILWGGRIERRIDNNAKDISHLEVLQEKNWGMNQKNLDELKKQLDKINDKLDQLIKSSR